MPYPAKRRPMRTVNKRKTGKGKVGKQSMAQRFTLLPELTGNTPRERAAQKGPKYSQLRNKGYRAGGPGESMARISLSPDGNTGGTRKRTVRSGASSSRFNKPLRRKIRTSRRKTT